jgi:hypothetical protein
VHNGNHAYYSHDFKYILLLSFRSNVGWLEYVGSRVVYALDYKEPILYIIPIQSIRVLGMLPLVPVGDTIPYSMCNAFSGAPGDRHLEPLESLDLSYIWYIYVI